MRALVAAVFSICVLVCACSKQAGALDCATASWWNFDRIDGDPQKQRQDAEARAALANLGPIVFRGRFASAHGLSDQTRNDSTVLLIAFKDVEVLRGEMPRSARDRKTFLLYYAWCDTSCKSAAKWWPRGLMTFNAQPLAGGPVTDTGAVGTSGGKVIYKGRVDAQSGACSPMALTPLQQQLLNAPAEEIARLMRDYPFHATGMRPLPDD
jgi:hypothetical protein